MTAETFIRAVWARHAWLEAGDTGSLACIMAVLYVHRNRVRAGWHGGDWMETVNRSHEAAAHPAADTLERALRLDDRNLQMALREVDNVFWGAEGDDTATVTGKCLYYQILPRPLRPWFEENIVRRPGDHPRRAHVGQMVLYE
jgi:hypothetical protein